jgi:hypothetical protein
MQSLKELVGLHFYETRAVFDVDGKELVYINDNFFGKASVYLNGEQIYQGWTWFPGMVSDITVQHDNHEYRVFSRILDWLYWSQKITLIVDDSRAQSKVDPVLKGLNGWSLAHAVVGQFLLGGLTGFAITYFSN